MAYEKKEITEEDYIKHLKIYLKFTWPGNEVMQKDVVDRVQSGYWFDHGIPDEARFGCHANGHMKMCVDLRKGEFYVSRNDSEDCEETQEECKCIKEQVEDAWRQMELEDYFMSSLKQVSEFMQPSNVPEDISEMFHHGVRGYISHLVAKIQIMEMDKVQDQSKV